MCAMQYIGRFVTSGASVSQGIEPAEQAHTQLMGILVLVRDLGVCRQFGCLQMLIAMQLWCWKIDKRTGD